MCWQLLIGVPPEAVSSLAARLPANAQPTPDPSSSLGSVSGRGWLLFRLGPGCACGLYRGGNDPLKRLEASAARKGWSAAKIKRAVAASKKGSGLTPAVRAALADVAVISSGIAVLLFWSSEGELPEVREEQVIDPGRLLEDGFVVRENRLLLVIPPQAA